MLTDKQKQIARDAYLSTLSSGEFLDVYAAVEAVLADQDERIHSALNAEQTSAAEQGPKLTCPYCISGDRHPQSTQPPAGDAQMVELIRRALDNTVEKLNDLADDVSNSRSFSRSYYACEQIEEARKQIEARICNHDIRLPHECKDCFDIFSDELRKQESIRLPSNRLAKPAERSDEQKVAAILNAHAPRWKDWISSQVAAEIVAALKAGKR